MNDARTEILARLGLGSEGDPANRDPATAPQDGFRGVDRIDRFCTKAQEVDATVAHLNSPADLADALRAYLQGDETKGAIRMAPHPLLQGVDWSPWPDLSVVQGAAHEDDRVGLDVAHAGIAETGTLVLKSGPDCPSGLSFLPATNVVVLPAEAIHETPEAMWAQLRRENDAHAVMPRALHWITGPSRTADIEQKLQLGVHGPKWLHIMILGSVHG